MEQIKHSFFELDGSEFSELISDLYVNILKNNLEYSKITNKKEKILEGFPKLRKILENKEVIEISKEECNNLIKILNLKEEMKIIEEKELFFLGGRESYNYFKKIGIIK